MRPGRCSPGVDACSPLALSARHGGRRPTPASVHPRAGNQRPVARRPHPPAHRGTRIITATVRTALSPPSAVRPAEWPYPCLPPSGSRSGPSSPGRPASPGSRRLCSSPVGADYGRKAPLWRLCVLRTYPPPSICPQRAYGGKGAPRAVCAGERAPASVLRAGWGWASWPGSALRSWAGEELRRADPGTTRSPDRVVRPVAGRRRVGLNRPDRRR